MDCSTIILWPPKRNLCKKHLWRSHLHLILTSESFIGLLYLVTSDHDRPVVTTLTSLLHSTLLLDSLFNFWMLTPVTSLSSSIHRRFGLPLNLYPSPISNMHAVSRRFPRTTCHCDLHTQGCRITFQIYLNHRHCLHGLNSDYFISLCHLDSALYEHADLRTVECTSQIK